MTLPRTGRVVAKVDWGLDGAYDGTYDEISSDLWHGEVLTIERGLDSSRILSRPIIPMATGKLKNNDGQYSTEFSGSPIHGQLQPGRPMYFGQELGDSDATMDDADIAMDDPTVIMGGLEEIRTITGFLDQLDEEPGRFFRRVRFRTLGQSVLLKGQFVTINYQATITTGAAAVLVFQALGLTASQYIVDDDAITNGRTMLHWYAYRRDAWSLLEEIWATEGPPAALYEDAMGRPVFEGRNYFTLTTRCQTIQHEFADVPANPNMPLMDDVDVTMDDPLSAMDGYPTVSHYNELTYEPGYKYIINDCTIEVQQRAVQATQEVWAYNGSIVLAANETVVIFAKTSNPVSSITTPVVTTDYTTTFALAAVSVTEIGGTTIALTLTASASGATVGPPAGGTGIRIRATPVTLVGTIDAEPTLDVTASQAEFGVRSLPSSLSIWRTMSPAVASGLADAYLLQYRDPRPILKITLQNRTGAILQQMLTREISDRIHVVDQNGLSGVDMDVQIRNIKFVYRGEWLQRVEFGCEKIVEQDWGLWDVAQWDIDVWGQ